jgi:hypothetical protein
MITVLLFSSYGTVMSHNLGISQGFMRNVMELYKPDFPCATYYWIGFNVVIGIPYLIILFVFLRNVKIFSFETLIVLTFTLIYGFIYANGRFREQFFPLIILWLGKYLEMKSCQRYTAEI